MIFSENAVCEEKFVSEALKCVIFEDSLHSKQNFCSVAPRQEYFDNQYFTAVWENKE